MQTTFSIIIPVYKGEKYISDVICNLAAQTRQDYEALFVNDNSPDQSLEIIRKYAEQDARIKILNHETNRGQGAARNTGLDNATGKFILYIDVDDSFSKHYLEILYNAIETDNADIAICNSIWRYSDRNVPRNMFLSEPTTDYLVLTSEQALRRYFHIYERDLWIPVEPWGKILRRDFIEHYHIRHPENLFEDVVMTFAELVLSKKVALISDHLYYYNNNNENAATNERQRQYVREIYRVPEGIFSFLEKHGLQDKLGEYATLLYFRYINGAYSFFSRGQKFRKEMIYNLLKYRSISVNPVVGDQRRYVVEQIYGFLREMKRYDWQDLFLFFAEPYHDFIYDVLLEKAETESNKKIAAELTAAFASAH